MKLHENILPDIDTFKRIHKQHLLNIPFENLNIFDNKRIEFDIEKMWVKIVEQKRGGICYELNGLLFHLLKYIGFDVKYISAKVLEDGIRVEKEIRNESEFLSNLKQILGIV